MIMQKIEAFVLQDVHKLRLRMEERKSLDESKRLREFRMRKGGTCSLRL